MGFVGALLAAHSSSGSSLAALSGLTEQTAGPRYGKRGMAMVER